MIYGRYKVIQVMTPGGQEGVLMGSKLNNSFEELKGYCLWKWIIKPNSKFLSIAFSPVGHHEVGGGVIGLYLEEILLKQTASNWG